MPNKTLDIYGESKEPKEIRLYTLLEEYKDFLSEREGLAKSFSEEERRNKSRSEDGILNIQDLDKYQSAKKNLIEADEKQKSRFSEITKLCFPDGDIKDWLITVTDASRKDIIFKINNNKIEFKETKPDRRRIDLS